MNQDLEYRMYFFVPYNISDIQKGIQAGHCAEQYARKYRNKEVWEKYVRKYKTWIILNGGTTNGTMDADGIPQGTLNQILISLIENEIPSASFYEPDLNHALTAVCFLASEIVYDFEKYPAWEDWTDPSDHYYSSEDNYIKVIMGNSKKNYFLRNLIKDKKLA